MAEKEATVYVVDVGRSMGERRNGRSETDLEWALKYIWDKIASAIATGRKTLHQGIVIVRSNGTSNPLDGDESYSNIVVAKDMGQMFMQDVRTLQEKLVPSRTNNGDVVSGIVVAMVMIDRFCKQLKYRKNIILVTNGDGPVDPDDIENISSKLKEDKIHLTILGADFDDPEYGFKEEDKDPSKAENEDILKSLAKSSDGVLGTINEAVSELWIPRVKQVKPIPSFKGQLTLGDPEQFTPALAIDVERYPRTMIAKPPSASNYVFRAGVQDHASAESSATMMEIEPQKMEEGDLAVVRNARTYQVKDENVAGGKRDVARDELARGYEYGRTAVHIAESEENVTKLETKAGMDIVGFVPLENVEHQMSMGRSNVLLPQKANTKAAIALSSLVRAMDAAEAAAVIRLVAKQGRQPELFLLKAEMSDGYEYLSEISLPFAEDIRSYKFPPLDRIPLVSGKVVTEHRNLPSQELKDAMSAYVDKFDISTFGKDEEGNPTEYMQMDETYSPMLHRLNQAVQYRAIHPDSEIPPPHRLITDTMRAPPQILEQASEAIQRLQAKADIKKVPPKALSRRQRFGEKRGHEAPKSGLDVEALLNSTRGKPSTARIDPKNAIPEFKQLLERANEISVLYNACSQLGDIIREWIKNSVGDANYGRAIEALRVFREECIELEEPEVWNDFVQKLKKDMLDQNLGGDRRECWWMVKSNRLGLIEKRISPESNVTEEEAKAFLNMR